MHYVSNKQPLSLARRAGGSESWARYSPQCAFVIKQGVTFEILSDSNRPPQRDVTFGRRVQPEGRQSSE